MTAARDASRSPAKRRLAAHVLGHSEQLAARVVARARAEMPAYAALPTASTVTATVGILSRLLIALRDGGPLGADDLRAIREFGETRARQGISLAEVQNGWRIAVRELLDDFTESGRTVRVGPRAMLELTHDLLEIVDEAAGHYTGGHRDVEIELAQHDRDQRAEYARGLLLGGLGPADIHIGAQNYGLDVERSYRAFRARPDDRAAGSALRLVLRGEPARALRGLDTVVDGDLAGFLESGHPVETAGLVGLGPPVRLGELDRSFRLASRMLSTAQVYGRTGAADLGALGVLPAVLADSDLGEELARRYLDPLGAGDQARTVIDTVERFFDLGMRVEATADALIVHQNTVRYRLSRFEELTGADLRTPHSAVQIWWAIQHRRAHPRP
ncbi:PucR family transcriptional regulator [Nocardia sp. NPDC003693]